MAIIHIDSIRQAITSGKLMDLAEDSRTSRSIRACLPRQPTYPFAISTTAFTQIVQIGTARARQARLDAIGAFLTHFQSLEAKAKPAELEIRFQGDANPSLKITWFGPDQYWVILLPEEDLQPAGTQ